MATSHELAQSIREYNEQLEQVTMALTQEGLEESSRLELEELQQNLMQLLELELEQLQNLQKQTATDDQYALFQSEIAELQEEGSDDAAVSNGNNPEIQQEISNEKSSGAEDSDHFSRNTEQDDAAGGCPLARHLSRGAVGGFSPAWSVGELNALEGAAVRAPYTEQWGGHTDHNAVVMSVITNTPEDEQLDDDKPLDYPEVIVLFSQPTSLAMLPCRYYLSDSCHYMDGSCQYSHGEVVPVDSLRSYKAPDSSWLESGRKVLCQHASSNSTTGKGRRGGKPHQGSSRTEELLWHPGEVVDVLHDKHILSIECSVCHSVVQCDTDKVVPLVPHDDNDTGNISHFKLSDARQITLDERESSTSQDDDAAGTDATGGAQQWLMNPPVGAGGLGEWEKHTRGIGSRLMQQMGYIAGTGLGKAGEGRVEPVPAYLYPQGVSLDRCMELRERSGGEDLLQVEKRLLREQKNEEKRLQREDDRLTSQTSVFDIINNRLSGPKPSSSSSNTSETEKLNVGRAQLKLDANKTLNVKGYQLSNRIKQLEREVDKLKQSVTRQGGHDTQAGSSIAASLHAKTEELTEVRRAEHRVNAEQQSRQHTKKLVVF